MVFSEEDPKTKHLLRICIWLKATDYRDLCHSFLDTDGKSLDSTNSWQGCIKRGQLNAGIVVAEWGLCRTSGVTSSTSLSR